LRNYDLVIDTSDTEVAEVVDIVLDGRRKATVYISPRNLLPTEDVRALRDEAMDAFPLPRRGDLVLVGRSGSVLFIVDGHKRTCLAAREGAHLVPAELAAEDDENLIGGVTARAFLADEASVTKLYDWESACGVCLSKSLHAELESLATRTHG
jgi:hypothetical protein